MKFSKKQRQFAFAGALVATSLCSVGLVSSVVGALSAGTPAAGEVVMTPSTGDSSTQFDLSFPTLQACPGDGPAGYQWTAYITSAANDLAVVTFNATGSPVTPSGFTASLRDSDQAQVKAQFPGLNDGSVNPPTQLTFASTFFNAVPAGDYWIAIGCYKADAGGINQTERFWATRVTIATAAGAGANNFTFAPAATPGTTTTTTVAGGTTTTTVAGGTTTTTVAGGTATTTTVAGATTTSTVAGGAAQAATLSPAVPTAGASYRVTHPNCRVGETITVTQAQSTPTSVTATCAAAAAGLVRPQQATAAIGTATVTFTAAPTAPGTYTVTSTGTVSGTRTATFVIVAVTPTTAASSGGSPTGTSTGTIPATGSSTTSIVVWGILLLVFGRMAILFGRKPKVISASR
jgi:hypothetical protein